jgi:hypothetical protein
MPATTPTPAVASVSARSQVNGGDIEILSIEIAGCPNPVTGQAEPVLARAVTPALART